MEVDEEKNAPFSTIKFFKSQKKYYNTVVNYFTAPTDTQEKYSDNRNSNRIHIIGIRQYQFLVTSTGITSSNGKLRDLKFRSLFFVLIII